MIFLLTTSFSHVLRSIPGLAQEKNITGRRELKFSKHCFGHSHFGFKPSTAFGAFRMVKFGPKGKEKFCIEPGLKDPLMATDMGLPVGKVFIPSASRHLFPHLFRQGIVDHEKQDRISFNIKGVKKVFHRHFNHFFLISDIIIQKAPQAGEESFPSRSDKGLNGGRRMRFLTQMDKSDNIGIKKLNPNAPGGA